MIKFSIIIPTRHRVNFLTNLLKSIYNTTKNKKEIEILVAYDYDDKETEKIVEESEFDFRKMNLRFYGRERGISTNNDYYNWIAKYFAKGKYLIISNDDALFTKQNWDELGWNKLEDYLKDKPDGIVYGVIEDEEIEPHRKQDEYFSCFPLFSRRIVGVLGFVFNPLFIRDGADWNAFYIYQKLGRVLDLRNEIIIRHLSYRSRRRKKDELDNYSMQFDVKNPLPKAGLKEIVQKLTNYINQFKK